MIGAQTFGFCWVGVVLPVAVFDPHELREAALRHKLAAQVPLAVVRAGVVVGHALGQRQMFGLQQVVVLDDSLSCAGRSRS